MFGSFLHVDFAYSYSLYVTSNKHLEEICSLCEVLNDMTPNNDYELKKDGAEHESQF